MSRRSRTRNFPRYPNAPVEQRARPDSPVTWTGLRVWGPIVLAFGTQTAWLTYMMTSTVADLRRSDTEIERKLDQKEAGLRNDIAAGKLEREANFVRKDEHNAQMIQVNGKLDTISKELSALTGYVQASQQKEATAKK